MSVCGIPGVGKSALVRDAAKIPKNDIYVDMSEVKNISDLIERLYS